MFLLDTDHIAILERTTQPQYSCLQSRMAAWPFTEYYYSIVSFQEQALGANLYISRAKDALGLVKGYELLNVVLEEFRKAQVVLFDALAASEFAALRARKVRIGTSDLRIAAIALTRNYTVLSRNLRDYTQVPGLKVEDWTM
jgi:tRNA(fMet)-specific endonuclease VapC